MSSRSTISRSNKGAPRQRRAPQAFTRAPVAVSATGRIPYASQRYSRKEYICEVGGSGWEPFGSVGFVRSFPINPGLSTSFPWLSTQAAKWTFHRFHKLKFTFESRVPTSTSGYTIISPDYNGLNGPQNIEELLDACGATRSSIWTSNTCDLLGRYMYPWSTPGGPGKLVRQTESDDLADSDCGVLWVFTTSASDCGQLFVEYDVTLELPQLSEPAEEVVNWISLHTTACGPISTGGTEYEVPSTGEFSRLPVGEEGENSFSISGSEITFGVAGVYNVYVEAFCHCADPVAGTPFLMSDVRYGIHVKSVPSGDLLGDFSTTAVFARGPSNTLINGDVVLRVNGGDKIEFSVYCSTVNWISTADGAQTPSSMQFDYFIANIQAVV